MRYDYRAKYRSRAEEIWPTATKTLAFAKYFGDGIGIGIG